MIRLVSGMLAGFILAAVGLGAGIGDGANPGGHRLAASSTAGSSGEASAEGNEAGRLAPNPGRVARLERDRPRQRYIDYLERVVHKLATRAERNERKARRLARKNGPPIHRIIAVAATAYGQSYPTLLRKARCESGLWPYARNRSSGATGLFQFMPSTWRSTPFGRHSIYDPFAQALAAAWMHSHLRGGEWACR